MFDIFKSKIDEYCVFNHGGSDPKLIDWADAGREMLTHDGQTFEVVYDAEFSCWELKHNGRDIGVMSSDHPEDSDPYDVEEALCEMVAKELDVNEITGNDDAYLYPVMAFLDKQLELIRDNPFKSLEDHMGNDFCYDYVVLKGQINQEAIRLNKEAEEEIQQ